MIMDADDERIMDAAAMARRAIYDDIRALERMQGGAKIQLTWGDWTGLMPPVDALPDDIRDTLEDNTMPLYVDDLQRIVEWSWRCFRRHVR